MFTKTAQVIGLLGTVVGVTAVPAYAGTAYMDGLGNIGPKWSTITGPNGETCPKATCQELRYDYLTPESAARVAGVWMDANNTPDSVLSVFSLGGAGASRALALRPDWQGTVIEYGSPAAPNSGNKPSQGGAPVPVVNKGKLIYVTADKDSVAQPGGSIFTHLNGYSGRNFQTETPLSSKQHSPNVTDKVYSTRPPSTRPTFNLFDIRTWFPTKTPVVTVERTTADERSQLRDSETTDSDLDSPVGIRTANRRSGNAGGQDAEEGRTVGGSPEREDRKNLLGSGQRGTRVDSSAGDDDGTTGAGNDGSASVSGDKKRGSNDGE